MASKEAKFHDVSRESEDCESDEQSLLEHALNPKSVRSQRKRHWAFLAVNAFVLLLNIGVLLMISAPKDIDEAGNMKTIPYPRFPHDGQLKYPGYGHGKALLQRLTTATDWIDDVIDFELQVYDDQFGNHGEFRGVPRPELDEAWASMYLESKFRPLHMLSTYSLTLQQISLCEFQAQAGGNIAPRPVF
jgi:hypothetical protein